MDRLGSDTTRYASATPLVYVAHRLWQRRSEAGWRGTRHQLQWRTEAPWMTWPARRSGVPPGVQVGDLGGGTCSASGCSRRSTRLRRPVVGRRSRWRCTTQPWPGRRSTPVTTAWGHVPGPGTDAAQRPLPGGYAVYECADGRFVVAGDRLEVLGELLRGRRATRPCETAVRNRSLGPLRRSLLSSGRGRATSGSRTSRPLRPASPPSSIW